MKNKRPIVPISGNHISKLLEELKSNPPKPGTINHVTVMHDEWCNLLSGKGPCNCSPDIQNLGQEQ